MNTIKKLCLSWEDNITRPISTWDALKKVMRAKYVIAHHKWDIFQKLQSLTIGGKSVDEYNRDIELAMMRANIDEDDEATIV